MNNRNQTFDQMNAAALGRLAGRDPQRIAQNAGILYDAAAQVFRLSTMGMDLTVTYPDYEITPALSGWHRLLVLHYLDLADGWPLIGKDITFGQMNSGMIRGGGIDQKCEKTIASFRDLDAQVLENICGELGGVKIPSNADAAYRIPFLPRFPVTLKVWLPDEEFPASGRLLVDESADHYLTIEDAVTVAEMILEKILKQKQQ